MPTSFSFLIPSSIIFQGSLGTFTSFRLNYHSFLASKSHCRKNFAPSDGILSRVLNSHPKKMPCLLSQWILPYPVLCSGTREQALLKCNPRSTPWLLLVMPAKSCNSLLHTFLSLHISLSISSAGLRWDLTFIISLVSRRGGGGRILGASWEGEVLAAYSSRVTC